MKLQCSNKMGEYCSTYMKVSRGVSDIDTVKLNISMNLKKILFILESQIIGGIKTLSSMDHSLDREHLTTRQDIILRTLKDMLTIKLACFI